MGKRKGGHGKTVEGPVCSAFLAAGSHHTPESLSVTRPPTELLNWNVSVSTRVLKGEERDREKEGKGGRGQEEEEPPLSFVHFLPEYDTVPRGTATILCSYG